MELHVDAGSVYRNMASGVRIDEENERGNNED